MARTLRPGWRLHKAGSAAQAIGILRGSSADERGVLPDLVIADVGLPDEDGFSLVRAIAAEWPGLPAALISGREDAAVRLRARAGGAAGLIAKTSGPQDIVGMLDAMLAGSPDSAALGVRRARCPR